jgi:hypothetical protein
MLRQRCVGSYFCPEEASPRVFSCSSRTFVVLRGRERSGREPLGPRVQAALLQGGRRRLGWRPLSDVACGWSARRRQRGHLWGMLTSSSPLWHPTQQPSLEPASRLPAEFWAQGQTSSGVQEWMPPLPPEEAGAPAFMPPLPHFDPATQVLMPPLPPEPQQAWQPPLPAEGGSPAKLHSPLHSAKSSPSQQVRFVMPPLPPTPPPATGTAVNAAQSQRAHHQPPPLPPLPEVPLDKCIPTRGAHLQADVWPWVVFLPESFACMDLLYPNHA